MTNITQMRNQSIIRHLEGLLEQAKNGELVSIAEVCAWRDDTTSSGWSTTPKAHKVRMIGEMRCLERDFMDALIPLYIDPRTGEEDG